MAPTSPIKKIFNWQRFWYPAGQDCPLDDQGFLVDPEGPLASVTKSNLQTYDDIANAHCLILLGEPGIGKTKTINQLVKSIASSLSPGEDFVLSKDLADYSSEDRLVCKIFQTSEMVAWKNGSGQIHLFLDSLDEGQILIKTISVLLCDEIKDLHQDRLFLRIISRSASFPNELKDCLDGLWKKDPPQIYHLTPLRRRDVELAVMQSNGDPDKFVEEVIQKRIVPLAVKPITLKMLLDLSQDGGTLPHGRTDLYEKGLASLAKESSKRLERGYTYCTSLDERLELASLWATVSLFSNRIRIISERNSESPGENALTLSEIKRGIETFPIPEKVLCEAALDELLNTGLFVQGRWAHRSYQEFLSAKFLADHKPGLFTHVKSSIHVVTSKCPETLEIRAFSGRGMKESDGRSRRDALRVYLQPFVEGGEP